MTSGARHAGGGLVRDVVLVLLLFVVGGLAAGLLWRELWTPVEGTAFEGVWYPETNSSPFSATGLYTLIAFGTGILAGLLSALVTDRRELVVLALVVAGSVLAGWVMLEVGQWGMPADPRDLAVDAANGTGWPALGAFPAGALLGLCVVFVGLSRKPSEDPHSVGTAG